MTSTDQANLNLTVVPIETPSLGDRSYLATDGLVALVVDPQRDTGVGPSARHRPGHRPGAFSDGSLLFGSVGRTDLVGPEHTEDLTRAQFAAAHRLTGELPPDTAL